jgi:hypothetical protein
VWLTPNALFNLRSGEGCAAIQSTEKESEKKREQRRGESDNYHSYLGIQQKK